MKVLRGMQLISCLLALETVHCSEDEGEPFLEGRTKLSDLEINLNVINTSHPN
jgi:hypothetical protein